MLCMIYAVHVANIFVHMRISIHYTVCNTYAYIYIIISIRVCMYVRVYIPSASITLFFWYKEKN